MQAVVLVGGRGTRLLPLTLEVPKQLVPVAGPTVLDRVLEGLAGVGVDRVVLSMGYQPDAFRAAHPGDRWRHVALDYATEPEPLDTAGGIAFAARHAGVDDTFLVVNSDVLHEMDLAALLHAHDRAGAEATVALTKVADPSDYGVVVVDPAGRVEAFVEKPGSDAPSDLVNAGIYVCEPALVERIEPGRPTNIERQVFPAMAAEGALAAVVLDGWWIDTGTPERLLEANRHLLAGGSAVDPGATVDARAVVEESTVAAGARVGEDAVVRRSVVMAGAEVGPGGRVEGCIVGPGARVGPGAIPAGPVVVRDEPS